MVGHALTAVGALDPVTAEEILTDFRLAVTVRQLHREPGRPRPGGDRRPEWLSQGRAGLQRRSRAPAPSPAGRTARGGAGQDAPTGSSRSG